MNSTKIDPKFISQANPRVGLIALASDFMIEKDFINVIKNKKIDFFVNRIECYNPLTKENLIKMSNKITDVTKDILPDQDLDCVVYGCTSGTIAAGHDSIEEKVKVAKPMADVSTPSTAAIKALKKLNIKKVSIFTPYSKKLNDDVLDYFKSEGFEVTSNSYFDIQDDYDIGKVDQDYLYEVLSKIDLNGADALFVSCTALPVLEIIDKLEKKLNTTVLSSNQALIWDTLVKIKKNNSVEGFGKLFQVN
jgi:maleate isomerase